MMTGDHPLTALHIAARLGIADESGTAITGKELAEFSFDNEDDARRIANTKVFARVSPEQKLRLVEFYQRQGRVVAMTGDGVNDAPALRKADIGVAMGLRGTEVAREASEVVLLNDAFATIVMAVREGRGVFANIRNFVVYLLSCNLSEILVVGLATAVRAPLPLLPLQILFLNLVTDVFPALALGATETEESVMRSPPRPPGQKVLGTYEWRRILGYGLAITGSVLFAFFYSLYELRLPTSTAVTVAFLSLALAQLWHVFNMTPAGSRWLGSQVMRNRLVWGALALCLVLLTLAVYWRPASSLLSLTPLSRGPLGLALLASALPLVVGFIVRGVGSLRSKIDKPVDKAHQYRATNHVADRHGQ
jgi:Ca2+-transporting ATPase